MMQRARPSLPPFDAGWTPAQAAAGARLLLPLSGDGLAFERQLDRLCAAWNHRPFSSSYLDATAPFVENVSMLENLWLPLAWRRGIRPGDVARRALPLLPLLGWSADDLRRLLLSRPGDLPPPVLARALVLRAALARPDWLLIEPGWFARPLLPLETSIALLQALLGDARWLLFWPAGRTPLPASVNWHTIQLEADAGHGERL